MIARFFLRAVAAVGFAMMALAAQAAPVQWSANGHWYDAIAGTQSWDEANAAAQSSVFMGMAGHLATITSADENAFISGLSPTPGFYILGGAQSPTATTFDGGWGWVTGEAWSYTNWNAPIEPNDGNDGSEALGPGDEDRLHFWSSGNASGLTWNDFSGTAIASGYVVEYEAAAVPEPETYGMLLAGMALLGFIARRRSTLAA